MPTELPIKLSEYLLRLKTEPHDVALLEKIWTTKPPSGTRSTFYNGDGDGWNTRWGYEGARSFYINFNKDERRRNYEFYIESQDGKIVNNNPGSSEKWIKIGTPLHEAIELIATLIFYGKQEDVSWCESFLQLHSDGPKAYKRPGLFFAYFLLAHSSGLDTKKQQALWKKLKWKISKNERTWCPISKLIVPKIYTERTCVNGKTQDVLRELFWSVWNVDWVFHDDFDLRAKGTKTRINLGFLPKNTTFITFHDFLNGEVNIPQPMWEKIKKIVGGEFVACEGCQHYIRKYIHECLCEACVSKKYPALQIRDYNADALSFVKIHFDKEQLKHQFEKLTVPFLMGCELEYNCDEKEGMQTRLKLLQHLNDFVIFKSDGSLNRGGFEIVTAPATYPVHKQKFKPVFDSFPKTLIASASTGMHIHLTRQAVTPLVIGRAVDFLNHQDNAQFVELIGERNFTPYCARNEDYSFGLAIAGGGARHTVLNLNKGPTIEFRFFQAPTRYLSFMKNLEFVMMLTKFLQAGWTPYTPKQSRHFSTFVGYVKEMNKSRNEDRNASPNLFAFLKEKGAI